MLEYMYGKIYQCISYAVSMYRRVYVRMYQLELCIGLSVYVSLEWGVSVNN
jgi:hypothetical protein